MLDPALLVSILIPAFNVEAFLAESIESALAQTYRPLEIIVVNDGSTDNTLSVAQRYEGGGEVEVVIVDQANTGLPGARNAALAVANGDFIGFLDADDLWEPDRTARLVAFLDAHAEFEAVTSDAWLIDETTLSTRRYYGDLYTGSFPTIDDQPGRIAVDNFIFIGTLVRRALLDKIDGFDATVRVSSDFDLWLRAILGHDARVGCIDDPLASYRLRPGSLTADPAKHWRKHLEVVDRHRSLMRSAGVRPNPRAAYDLARAAEQSGHYRSASRWYADAAMATRGRLIQRAVPQVKLFAAAGRARLRSLAQRS